MNMKEIDCSALLSEAQRAHEAAYAPYSACKVGAALLCADGEIYTGMNIENAALSPGICAERTAFVRALADGKREFVAIAVCGENENNPGAGGCFYPCGVCRQFMREFCGADFRIITGGVSGTDYVACTLAELLPHGFGPENLEKRKG